VARCQFRARADGLRGGKGKGGREKKIDTPSPPPTACLLREERRGEGGRERALLTAGWL